MKRDFWYSVSMVFFTAYALWNSIDYFKMWYEDAKGEMAIPFLAAGIILLVVAVAFSILCFRSLRKRENTTETKPEL